MSEDHITDLKAENAELRLRVERLEAEREMARTTTSRIAALATYLFLGPRLVDTFRHWLQARSLTNPIPTEETAQLGAAIVRRVVRVGWIGLAVASLPIVLLFWQNMLLQGQIERQDLQIARQAADTLIVRRAQLLATIYDCEIEEGAAKALPGEKAKSQCVPTASSRARQEAVAAFITIERSRGVIPDLSYANLSQLRVKNLTGVNLTEANLAGANLTGINLTRADHAGVNLIGANLAGAKLSFSDLTEAFLSRSNLMGANLSEANLTGAYLSGSNLLGANLRFTILLDADLTDSDLREVKGITEAQLSLADGNYTTILPDGLEYPAHWPTKETQP